MDDLAKFTKGKRVLIFIQITSPQRKNRLGNLKEYLEEVLNLFRILRFHAELQNNIQHGDY